MRVDLRYGEGFLPLEIPHRYDTDMIVPRAIIALPDYTDEINRSLENAINSEPLSQLLSQVKTAAIVVNNDQDIELSRNLLNIILEILRASTTNPDDAVVLFSPKFDSLANLHEIDYVLGEPTAQGHQLILHDSKDDENLCYLGETSTFSTPVSINKAFTEADIRIGLGTIRHDIFIGATGGRISVIPNVSGSKTIVRNSKLQAIKPTGPFVTDSAACVDMDEISRIAGLDFIVNAVPDYNNTIASITAGDPYSAWQHGISVTKTLSETIISQKADIAIVSAGGASTDDTLYTAIDSLYSAKEATAYGGTIVLVAECANGPGPRGFLKGVSECKSESDVAFLAETNFEMGMEKARFYWSVLSSRKIIICSRLRESSVVEHFHSLAVKDPQEGLELAREQIVSNPSVAVIPMGNRTLPVLKKG